MTAARDVWWVDTLLTQVEDTLGMTKRIRLEVLIEDVAGVAHAEDIATSSPRLDALIFGGRRPVRLAGRTGRHQLPAPATNIPAISGTTHG